MARKSSGRFSLRPFEDYRARLIIATLMQTSPVIGSLPTVRRGVRLAVKKLQKLTIGVFDQDDAKKIADEILELKVQAEGALLAALEILGHNTALLRHEQDYTTFSHIALPERGAQRDRRYTWSAQVRDSVLRHCMATCLMKQELKSAPTYRRKGHDYCQDMLEMCVRVIMRPGVVKFSRAMEKKLGWVGVEKSGILDLVQIQPKYSMAPPQ